MSVEIGNNRILGYFNNGSALALSLQLKPLVTSLLGNIQRL